MLLHYAYEKLKTGKEKHPAPKSKSPVLSPKDEQFLERIVSDDELAPPLPPRRSETSEEHVILAGEDDGLTPEDILNGKGVVEETQSTTAKGKGKEKEEKEEKVKKENKHFSFHIPFTKKDNPTKEEHNKKSKKSKSHSSENTPLNLTASPPNEEKDITEALEKLNLAASNNKAFSLSAETRSILQKFTVILKDLVNGVPTAYDDLVHLLDDSQHVLQKNYNHLPSYLQKLVKTLPTKLTSLGPEFLAVAAESQALNTPASAASTAAAAAAKPSKFKSATKAAMKIPTLKDLVTKQGAVVGMLRAIMNVLKLRWPAFVGTNVLWSLGLFVLLFVFWYCHKRGKEVRLEKEEADRVAAAAAEKEGEASGTRETVGVVGTEEAVAAAPVPATDPSVPLLPVEHAGDEKAEEGKQG